MSEPRAAAPEPLLNVTRSMVPYILFQRTSLRSKWAKRLTQKSRGHLSRPVAKLEACLRGGDIIRRYVAWMHEEFQTAADHLPDRVEHVLDIG